VRQGAGACSHRSVPVGCGYLHQQFCSDQKRSFEENRSKEALLPAFWLISSSELGVQKQDTVLDETELEDAVTRHT